MKAQMVCSRHSFASVIATLSVTLLLIPAVLVAQDSSETNSRRFDLTPLFGYRTPVSFAIEPAVQGTHPRVVFDGGPSYGVAFGVRFHRDDVIELRWARQQSHTHLEDVSVLSSPQRAILDQYHGDFTHEYVIDEWPTWAKPFVIGSVGATRMSGNANPGFTRFSFGIGGGVKLFAGKHLGFRVQAEWLPIVLDPHATVFCGGGCIVHVGGTLGSQGEITVGPLLRF